MKRYWCLAVAVSLFTIAEIASATVFEKITDTQLIDRSDAVVIGVVQDAVSRRAENGIVVTDYHLVVEDALKGTIPDVLTITEVGGTIGTRFTFIADSATYAPGERVLAFLKRRSDGTFFATAMALGKFTFDGAYVVRDAEELENDPLRVAETFQTYVRRHARGESANANYVTASVAPKRHIAVNGTAEQYAVSFADVLGVVAPARWKDCELTTCWVPSFETNGGMPYATSSSIRAALAAWSSDPNSNIRLTPGPTTTVDTPRNDGHNVILLGYGGSSQGICDSSQTCTLLQGDAADHQFDGDNWHTLGDTDIMVSADVPSEQFDALITLELGHAIGLRHSNAGTPSSAIMTSQVNSGFGNTLSQYDKDAIAYIYGLGLPCTPPSGAKITGGGTVASGSRVRLTATVAAGTTPLNYQWFDGLTGDRSNPVGTNSAQFTTPPITTTKHFWIRVSNFCGSSESQTVTLTVQTCQRPAITIDPQSQTIVSGGAATLTVGTSGTAPFTYQWYQGQTGDVSNSIVGANASQFTTSNLTQTTSFWVRVSNACGSADSATATITVPGSCVAPSFTMQPGSLTLDSGQQTFLAATATNATSYQWFKGAAGDESNPMSGGTTPSNARFVNQLYIDVLGRPADAAAVNALASQLDSKSATRAQVAQVVLTSNEYRTNLIADYYKAYLHRAPTVLETPFWMPAFTAGITDEQFASQIVGSAEYFALAASSNAVWLSHVYNDVLGRSPTAADMAFFAVALATNSRTTIALTILTSAEARTRLVNGWFSRFLRRSASPAEVSSFVGALASAKDEQIMALILALDEYFNFGTILPTGALASTTSFWVKATNANGNCSTNSSTATVTIPVCSPPVIVAQPQNTTANIGETAVLSVNATGATSYQWYRAGSGDPTNPVGTDAVLKIPLLLTGVVDYWVKVSNACGSANSATVVVTTNCVAPKPVIAAPPSVPSLQAYVVSFTGGEQVTFRYDLDEARSPDFTIGLRTFEVMTNSSAAIQHMEITADTRFYYRVRSDPLCGGIGEYSQTASVLVTAPLPATNPSFNLVSNPCSELQACSMTQNLFIAGFTKTGKSALDANDTFSVTTDKPFIAANPSSGPLPPEGANVVLTINTSVLQIGSTEATLTVTKVQASSKGVLGTTTSTVPVSVSLVTPVTPTPKDSLAPANTVLIPAIAHADGFNSQFQSDVRITNTAQQPIIYLLTYTPSNTDGTQNGKQTSITVGGGETKALNDIVKNWYGSGSLGEPGIGTLEIRPLNYAGKTGIDVSFATVAASRTYNTAANGTFGQYIPAIPLIDFLAKSDVSKISLQQVAQSAAYRTNLGFVEGSGQPVDFVATLVDDKNNVIATRSYSLRPFEHQQTNLSSFFPRVSVSDGRIEVIVTSDTGRVTAYASVLDNTTSDPLLVFPVDPSKIASSRFVVPGVAELNNGAANFHTDMRVFNGSTAATNVTLSFPANSALQPVQKQLAAGEVWAIDNVLPTLWNTTGGGAVVATSDTAASLVVTARTYSRGSDGGTFGQFIPGVTAADAVGVGDRPLQVVQLEQSPAFRSNLGLVEVTGNPVTVDVAAYTPESKIAAHTQVTLAPGQFTQLGSVLAGLGFTSNVYNGRIAVTAIGGTGRAAAYGSIIDNRTQDSTYVPAQ